MASLRVGLLGQGAQANGYVRGLVDWARSHDGVDITHLLLVHPSARNTRRSASSALSRWAVGLITAVESRIFPSSPVFDDNRERVDLRRLIPELATVDLSVSPEVGPNPEELARISALQLDLLIDLEGMFLPDELLTATRLGVVTVANGDDRVKRGGPDGFWEVFEGWETTGFTIRHHTVATPGGSVMRRGLYPTRRVFALNQASIRAHSIHHLQSLIRDVVSRGSMPEASPDDSNPGKICGWPTATQMLTYLGRLFRRFLPRAISKLRRRTARWGVAYVPRPWREADMRRGTDIPNRPGHFLADPFVVDRGGDHFCFVEDYDYSRRRAHIGVFGLNGDESIELGPAIEEPFHLSFPYVFEFDGQLFMCPESAANQDVRIYRCVDFPLRWELAKVVWSDRKAWDTVIFPHQGSWWLLTALDPIGTGNYSSELYAFYADSPLADLWSPHECNPVVIDHTKARNGGLIIDRSGIFRVSQRHGFGTYGRSSAVHRIAELSPNVFREELVKTIEPDFRSDIEGTHHLHSDGTFTVFDFVRRQRPDT